MENNKIFNFTFSVAIARWKQMGEVVGVGIARLDKQCVK